MKYSMRAMLAITSWISVACAAFVASVEHQWLFDVYMLFALLVTLSFVAAALAMTNRSLGWRIGFSLSTVLVLLLFYGDIPFVVQPCSRMARFACFDVARLHTHSQLTQEQTNLMHFRLTHLTALHFAIGFGALSGLLSAWLAGGRQEPPTAL